MVNDSPLHICPPLALMTGDETTETFEMAVFELAHPKALVPVTEKLVVDAGETIFEPPEYVYVDAPVGMMVKLLPEHTEPLFTVIVGSGFTTTTVVAVPMQPFELVPETV